MTPYLILAEQIALHPQDTFFCCTRLESGANFFIKLFRPTAREMAEWRHDSNLVWMSRFHATLGDNSEFPQYEGWDEDDFRMASNEDRYTALLLAHEMTVNPCWP